MVRADRPRHCGKVMTAANAICSTRESIIAGHKIIGILLGYKRPIRLNLADNIYEFRHLLRSVLSTKMCVRNFQYVIVDGRQHMRNGVLRKAGAVAPAAGAAVSSERPFHGRTSFP